MTTHRLVIIGVGSIGERHLRCAQRTERAELAICEVNTILRNTVAERYGIRHVYADLDSTLTFRHTAAVICVPAQLLEPMAIQLAEAGVHVLIEKPLSTSLEGVTTLQQIVQQHNVMAAVAYILRANPNLTAMRQVLKSGRFGKPVQLVACAGQNFPFYRPAYRQTYYQNRATGGGAIQDALTHIINSAEWLVGPINQVVADAAHCLIPGVDVEDTVHVMARHGDVLASYSLSQHQAPNEITISVNCEQGTLRCDLHENRWRWIIEPGNDWHVEQGPPHERDDLFVNQLKSFLDAVDGSQPPLCSLADGTQTLRVNLAILRSLTAVNWTGI